LEFTCTLLKDLERTWHPTFGGYMFQDVHFTARTSEQAQEVAIKAAQGVAAAANKRVKDLVQKLEDQQTANTGFSEKLFSAQASALKELSEQARVAYIMATAAQQKGVVHDNAISELQAYRTATDQRFGNLETSLDQNTQATIALGDEIAVLGNQPVKKSVFGGKKPLDPEVAARVANATKLLRERPSRGNSPRLQTR
jgi:hypothetical protein